MKRVYFYLAAIALHVLVLFGIPTPAPQSFAAKEDKKYVEVTLEAGPLPGAASPEPTSAPPPPGPTASPPVTVSPPIPPLPEPPPPPPVVEPPPLEPPPPITPSDFADVAVPVPPPPLPLATQEGPVAQLASQKPAPVVGPLAAPDGKISSAPAAGAEGGTGARNITQWSVGSGGNGHYYEAICIPEGVNWMEAQKFAVTHGGYLVTITSAAENAFVFNLIKDPRFWQNSPARASMGPWLGGFRSPQTTTPNIGWEWVNHEGLFTYTNWDVGQPDNRAGVENRLQFYSGRMINNPQPTWNDEEITLKVRGFVVEYDRDPIKLPYNPNASLELDDLYTVPSRPLTRH